MTDETTDDKRRSPAAGLRVGAYHFFQSGIFLLDGSQLGSQGLLLLLHAANVRCLIHQSHTAIEKQHHHRHHQKQAQVLTPLHGVLQILNHT